MIRDAAQLAARLAGPSRGARWTVVVVDADDAPSVLAQGSRLAAEDAAVVLLDGLDSTGAMVVLDSDGVVQHVGHDVEDVLRALRDLRVGDRHPTGRRFPRRDSQRAR